MPPTRTTSLPQLPPAPQIPGETMLEIFVHRSLRFPGAPLNTQPAYGDAYRLAAVGNRVLEAAYAYALFSQHPPLNGAALEAELDGLGQKIERWVAEYKWKDKVRHAQDVDLNTSQETRRIMDAYVGGVLITGGFMTVTQWIAALVQYGAARQRGPGP